MTLNEIIKKAHENAVNKGFYSCYCKECKKYNICDSEYREPSGSCDDAECNKNIGELLMLVVSELGEALEAHRKNHFAMIDEFNKAITDGGKILAFECIIKDTFEDELADAVIRICDMCAYLNIDLEKHIELKMRYNETREYKHGKAY